jgi:hypothetical protein
MNGRPASFSSSAADRGARHLHQAHGTFLHTRPAGCGEHDQRRFLQHGQLRRSHQPLADGSPHGPAHEAEFHGGDDGRRAANRAVRHHDRVVQPGLAAGLLQPVGVFLAVAKPQRVGRHPRQFDARERRLVERPGQTFQGGCAHVVAAMHADAQVLFQLLGKDHLLAGRALRPEIVGYIALAEQGADAGANEGGEPAHAIYPPSLWKGRPSNDGSI